MSISLDVYFSTLAEIVAGVEATEQAEVGRLLVAEEAMSRVIRTVDAVRAEGGKAMFIGNGGSAGIASHMAIDFLKNGKLPSLAFNDGAALTCLGNDCGYEAVFARQIEAHGRAGDLLFAVSSSGRSANILSAVTAAKQRGCQVITFSGFDADNPLRRMGDINFYLASHQYGFVEAGHLVLIHAILDINQGWTPTMR